MANGALRFANFWSNAVLHYMPHDARSTFKFDGVFFFSAVLLRHVSFLPHRSTTAETYSVNTFCAPTAYLLFVGFGGCFERNTIGARQFDLLVT